MKKLVLSIALATAVFAATPNAGFENEQKILNEKFNKILEQQFEINNQQEKINNQQIDVNNVQRDINNGVDSQVKSLKDDLLSIKYKVNNSGSAKQFDDSVRRLEDKIYRIERNASDQDTRIRKLESKVR